MSPSAQIRAPRLLACLALAGVAACHRDPATGAARALASADAPGGLQIVDPPNPDQPWDFDLGTVPLGEKVTRTILLRSDEDRPLTLKDMTSPCSCTSLEIFTTDAKGERVAGDFTGEGDVIVLPPRAQAELVVHVDTEAVPARNTAKRIRLVARTDSPTDPFLAIEVHLVVDQPFQMVPGVLRLGNVPASQGTRAEAKVVSQNERGEVLSGAIETPPDVRASLELDLAAVFQQWTLSVEMTPPVAPGPFERILKIGTTGPAGEGRPYAVRITGVGVADIAVDPTRFAFSSRAVGASAEVEVIAHLVGARLMVKDVRLDAAAKGLLKSEATPIEPDTLGRSARWKVRLYAERDLPAGPFGGRAIIATDDPESPELSVPYLCTAR